MYMDRPLSGHGKQRLQLFRRDGAQAVGRHPHPGVRQSGGQGAAIGDKGRIAVEVGDEPSLTFGRRQAAEAGMGVEDRQQGQADARRLGRRRDPGRNLRPVGVRRAGRVVVEVVELRHPGEAALQHFGEGQGRDGLDLVRPAPIQKPVHQTPPRPEVVIGRPPRLGQTGHGALKGVAVQIGDARQGHAAALVLRRP